MQFEILKKPTEKEFQEIEKFVRLHPNNSIFQSPLFFKSCVSTEKFFPTYITAYDDDCLVGALLSFRQVQINRPILSFLSSRNIIWGGPLVLNGDLSIYEGLYKEYEKIRPRALYTQIRNLYDVTIFKEFMSSIGFNYEEHLDIIINLEKTEERLWAEIDTKRRNSIRKAVKEGTIFEMKNDKETLIECYEILKEVYTRAKLPIPEINHFLALLTNSSQQDGLKIFIAKFDNIIIGCMLCLTYENTIFDYYAGAYSSYYHKCPNDLIPWEVLKLAKNMGYTRFVFGGAGKPNIPYGVREYKKKFGGEFVNFGRFEKVHMPILYKIAKLGLAIWKYLKK